MDNKKILKAIIITVIIIILLLIITIYISIKNKYTPTVEYKQQEQEQNQVQENETEEVTEDKIFYKVNNIINIYLDAINKSKYVTRDGESFADTEETKTTIYNMLSEEYIKENNITIDNVYEKVYDINEKKTFAALEMNVIEDFGISKYIVYGETFNIMANNQTVEPMYIIVNLDEKTGTFSIEQVEKKYKDIDEINVKNNIEEIKENSNNKFNNSLLTDEYIALQKFNNFKMLNLVDSKLVYDKHLDKEYKEKRFPTYEDYLNYLKINKDRFTTMTLYQYSSKEEDNTLQNVFTDTNGTTYKFTQTKSSDYTVLLDGYTVISEETKKEYMSKSNKQKVQANISKWIEMINNKDYLAAYDALDETFRNNQFGSIENFVEKVKKIFTKSYTVDTNGESDNFKEENGVYIQKIELREKETKNLTDVRGTVIMELKEGTDFSMSIDLQVIGVE